MAAARGVTLLLGVLALLGACRPLYLPPVPQAPPFVAGPRVAAGQALMAPGQRPRLKLELADVGQAGWLAVQWLGPSGRELASESVWLDPAQPPLVAQFVLPADVALVSGEWRAVVSLEGVLLRQYGFLVP